MGLFSLFKEIFRSIWRIIKEVIKLFTFWIPIKEPPKWVWKAFNKWERRLPTHPYDMVKIFVGKRHVYKFYGETIGQGQVEYHWYIKPRIK